MPIYIKYSPRVADAPLHIYEMSQIMKNALVLIPTYNEAANIQHILAKLISIPSNNLGYQLSILVLDDNSPDGTGDLVAAMSELHPNVHLNIGKKKGGLGSAYLRGFAIALETFKADVIIMMDADMSHDPSAIPSLLQSIAEGSDYAIGSRYTQGGTIPGNWPLLRILNSRVANNIAARLTGIGTEISDLTGGYKAIRGSTLREIGFDHISATGYVFQLSLLYTFLENGAHVTEVPIAFADRTLGKSKMRTFDILEFIYRAYKLNPQSNIRRMLTFGMVGCIGVIVNVVILSMLIANHVPAVAAAALAVEVSIITNFSLHNTFTFKNINLISTAQALSRPSHLYRILIGFYRFMKFNVAALTGAAVTIIVFTICFKFLGINYIIADIVAIGCATILNYKSSTGFVWRQVRA
jgi:dolichol-phosphate mannosyltransferase